MRTHHLRVRIKPEDTAYFDACARIRGISVSALMARLIKAISTDQMISAVLDDEGDTPKRRQRREYRYKEKKYDRSREETADGSR